MYTTSKTKPTNSLLAERQNAAALKTFLSEITLPKEGRKGSKELGGRSDPKPGAVCNCLCKVLGIVRQQPVGLAGHRGEEYRNVCGVPNEMAA